MVAILFRLALLALGLGLVETGLLDAMAVGSPFGWLTILVGIVLLVAGTAGFMGVLLGGDPEEGRR